MDNVTAAVVVVGILGLVLIAFFAVFRGKGGFKAEGLGVKVQAKGENSAVPAVAPPRPGVRIKDVEAGGSVRAEDRTGRGADVEGAKAVRGDVTASSDAPPPNG